MLPRFRQRKTALLNHLHANCEECKFVAIERGFSEANIDAALRAGTGLNLRIMPASLWEANGMAPSVEISSKASISIMKLPSERFRTPGFPTPTLPPAFLPKPPHFIQVNAW